MLGSSELRRRADDEAFHEFSEHADIDLRSGVHDRCRFPDEPAAVGRDAIIALVRRYRSDPRYSLRWQADTAEVAASGELGYTSGRFTATFGTEDGGTVTRTRNYVCIWRKLDDGEWKCIVETSAFEPNTA